MDIVALDTGKLDKKELADLKWAYQHLEHPSLAARLSNFIGGPIEDGLKLLPRAWYDKLYSASEASIERGLRVAIKSMDHVSPGLTHNSVHRLMAAGTGAVGGLLGPITLIAELPIMTMLILRSIADVAHSEGEDLADEQARVACMEVFALGGRSKEDDAAEAGYYGIRTLLSFHFSISLLGTNTGNVLAIPGGVEFIRAIASRFTVVISDKAAAKMIPVAGALSGAALNVIFMKHFQDVARGHFIVRRLERKYGVAAIKRAYQNLTRAEAKANKEFSPVEGW
jgi:hypothetical protein